LSGGVEEQLAQRLPSPDERPDIASPHRSLGELERRASAGQCGFCRQQIVELLTAFDIHAQRLS
jgi:hypothetical protein